MTRPGSRLIVVLGPLLLLATRLPLPEEARVALTLLALLIGWPAALWPVWRPLRGLRPQEANWGAAAASPMARVLVGWLPISMIPLLVLALLGALGMSLPALLVLWCGGLVLTTLLAWRHEWDPRARFEIVPRNPAVLVAVVGLLLLAAWVVGQGPPLSPLDDAYDHLAALRHLVTSDRLEFPGAFYGRDLPPGWDPRKGGLHLGLALAARLARVDALTLWRVAPGVLALLTGLVYLGFARAVLGRGLPAAAALAALLLLTADPGRFVRGAYGGHWGLVTAWAGIALGLSGGGALWGILCGAAAAGVHAYAPAQLLAPLGALVVWPGGSRAGRSAPRPVAFLVGALVGAVPVEAGRLLLSASGGNPLHAQFMPLLVLPFGPIASPLEMLRAWSIPGAVSALALLLLGIVRPDPRSRYFAATALSPLLVLLVPGVFAWVGSHFGSVANKLLVVWEPGVAIVAVMAWPVLAARRQGRLRNFAVNVLVLLTTATVLAALPARFDLLLHGRAGSVPADIATAVRLVENYAPASAVIVTDPVTAYALTAFTDRRTTVTLHQHAPPGDIRALERIAAAAAVFAPCVDLQEALTLARREGGTHVLFVPGPPQRVDQYANHTDPRNEPALARRFENPSGLEIVAREGPCRLYAIRAGQRAAEEWQPVANLPTAPAGGGGVRVSDKEITLAVTAPGHMETWSRGEPARLAATWTRNRSPSIQYTEVVSHIRFEHADSPRLAGIARVFAKPLRKMYLERKAGGSFRWRAVEMPFRGACPVATWPLDCPLADTLQFMVPQNLIPGRHRLRVSLERGTLFPVLTPADLMSDEDRFSGPVLGYVEIR